MQKSLWQNSTSIHDKSPEEIEVSYLNIIKDIYNEPIADIILNLEKVRALPLKSGISYGCQLLSLLFGIVLQTLFKTIRQY
jgi:hypothetical protein